VTKDIISEFVLRTFAPKTDMSFEMMLVAILRIFCKPCSYNRFAMPKVAICTKNIGLPAVVVGIMFKGATLEYPPE